MKCLVFSDLHLHPFRAMSSYRDGENSRRLEIISRLAEIVKIAEKEDCDLLLFAGDFFHERRWIDVASVSMSYEILRKTQIPIVACSGTHDLFGFRTLNSGTKTEKKVYLSTLDVFRGLNNVWIDDNYHSDTGFSIYCLPHIRPQAEQNSVLETIAGGLDTRRMNILLGHGALVGSHFSGKEVGFDEGIDPELLDVFDLTILGHIHDHFFDLQRKILIPGAAIPVNFGNTEPGRCWILEILPEEKSLRVVREHIFEHPKFVTLKIDNQYEGAIILTLSDEDYYRIIVPEKLEVKIENCDPSRFVIVREVGSYGKEGTSMETVGLSAGEIMKRFTENLNPPLDKKILTLMGETLSRRDLLNLDRSVLLEEIIKKCQELF